MQLHFKSFGSGEPVLILHGFLGMLDNWQTFGMLLSKDYMVYLIDLPNHGRSSHTAHMSYPALALHLKIFIDEHLLHKKVSIVGHSMGGKIAMQFAADYPNAVDHLFVIDIAPRKYEASHLHILSALDNIMLDQMRSRREVESALLLSLKDQTVVSFLMKNLARSDGGLAWKMNLETLQSSYDEILSSPDFKEKEPFVGPSLFYKGSRSDYIKVDDIDLIQMNFSNSKVIVVPEAGHWIQKDNMDFLLNSIRHHLA